MEIKDSLGILVGIIGLIVALLAHMRVHSMKKLDLGTTLGLAQNNLQVNFLKLMIVHRDAEQSCRALQAAIDHTQSGSTRNYLKRWGDTMEAMGLARVSYQDRVQELTKESVKQSPAKLAALLVEVDRLNTTLVALQEEYQGYIVEDRRSMTSESR